jgi:hypothetical protein
VSYKPGAGKTQFRKFFNSVNSGSDNQTSAFFGQHRATFEQEKKTKKQSTNYKPISYEKYNTK